MHKCFRFGQFAALLALSACFFDAEVNFNRVRSSGVSTAPSAFSIVSDVDLEFADVEALAPLAAPVGGLVAADAGTFPVAPVVDVSGTGNFSAAAPAQGGVPQGETVNLATPINMTSALSATITITSTYLAGATKACEVNSPLDPVQIPCAFDTFPVDGADLEGDSFEVKGFTAGFPADFLLSNALPIKRVSIRQVTNFTGNQATHDTIDILSSIFHDGKLYFAGQDTGIYYLYAYNPTAHTIERITAGHVVATGTVDSEIIEFNDKIYFPGSNVSSGEHLIQYDPAGPSLTQIANTRNDQNNGGVGGQFFIFNSKLHFWSLDHAVKSQLYSYDGTTLTQLSDFTGGGLEASNGHTSPPFVFNNKAYMQIYNNAGGLKLFEYDPTLATGTRFAQKTNTATDVTNTDQMNDDFGFGSPPYFNVIGNNLYFVGLNKINFVPKLFSMNFTSGVITQLGNTRTDETIDDGVKQVITLNNKLYFVANYNGPIRKLFEYDPGGGVTLLTDINGGGGHDLRDLNYDPQIVAYDDKIFFAGINTSGVSKLFSYNPVDGEVRQVANTTGNNATEDWTDGFVVYGNKLYFGGADAAGDYKIYAYDASSDKVYQVSNMNAGSDDWVGGYAFKIHGNRLYFIGISPGGGRKLFALCDRDAGCTN